MAANKQPLGIELVKRGIVTQSDISTALEYQSNNSGEKLGEIVVEDSDIKQVELRTNCAFYYPLSKSEVSKVKVDVKAPQSIKAPISAGQEVGGFDISIENQLIFSDKFYIIDNIESNTYTSALEKVIEGM